MGRTFFSRQANGEWVRFHGDACLASDVAERVAENLYDGDPERDPSKFYEEIFIKDSFGHVTTFMVTAEARVEFSAEEDVTSQVPTEGDK